MLLTQVKSYLSLGLGVLLILSILFGGFLFLRNSTLKARTETLQATLATEIIAKEQAQQFLADMRKQQEIDRRQIEEASKRAAALDRVAGDLRKKVLENEDPSACIPGPSVRSSIFGLLKDNDPIETD